MTVLMEGMLAIQAGAAPQLVRERLGALVSDRSGGRSRRTEQPAPAEDAEDLFS